METDTPSAVVRMRVGSFGPRIGDTLPNPERGIFAALATTGLFTGTSTFDTYESGCSCLFISSRTNGISSASEPMGGSGRLNMPRR